MEAGYVFSAQFFTSLLSLSFRRDNNQVCKKDSLLLEILVARDVRRGFVRRLELTDCHMYLDGQQ